MIKVKSSVFTFPGQIACQGQYSFPFSISLPEGLPATVLYSGPSQSFAQVKYALSGILQLSDGSPVQSRLGISIR